MSSARANWNEPDRDVKRDAPLRASPSGSYWPYVAFCLIAAGGCALDLATKHWVFSWRGMPRPHNEWWIIEGFWGIETALNPGALFGLGAGGGKFFAGLSIVAAIGILYLVFVKRWARDPLLLIALGCILGGILGNLYDRLGLWSPPGMPGHFRNEVRDWILFRFRGHTWPNFNIADSLLVVGAGLLMVHAWWFAPEEPAEEESRPSTPSADSST